MTFSSFIILIVIGLLTGFASGTLGIGGGIVMVPALVFIMGLTQHQAQGTSLAVISLPVALLGAYNYYKTGNVNLKFALILALTFVIGGYLGSLMSVNIPEKMLKKIFGGVLLLLSLKMIFSK